MNKPYFSIITPTYNCIDYLKECIKSINDQAFQSFEHIIIDDGSSDQTKDYLLKNKTKRQKLIFINHSGLPGIARNIGLKNAEGKYICFLDSDDFFAKNKLKILYEELKNNEFDLIYHDEFAKKNNRKYKLQYPKVNFINKNNLVKYGNRLSTSTITVSNKFLVRHNLLFSEKSNHKIVEDYHLWLRILNYKPKIKKLYKYLSCYRIHNKGISSNKIKLINNEKDSILDLFKNDYISKKQLKFAIKRLEFIEIFNYKGSFNLLLKSFLNFKNLIYFLDFYIHRLLEQFLKIINKF